MGYRHYGVNTGGLPVNYIRNLLTVLDVPIFIETGTAGGESVRAASSIFAKCHTIEVVEGRPQGEFPINVELHEGDSAKLLSSIVEKYKTEWIFFWLDAHWSEPYASEEDQSECPLIDEIKAINHAQSIIMIDDARLFFGPPVWPCDPRKWPVLKDVFLHLHYKFPDHITTIIDDYIVCLPQQLKDTFYHEWRGRFFERFPTEEEKIRLATRKAYENLMKYIE